ncbi:MAG: hypothetical protein AAB436_03795 [Patescibacteria group bacterium]|mgnify:CR=1 FL=1
MAKVDIKSPSEDENFDVKADEAAEVADATTDTSTGDTSTESSDADSSTEEAPADVSLSPEEPETPAEAEPTPTEETPEAEPAAEEPAKEEEPAVEESKPDEPAPPVVAAAPAPQAKSSVSTGRLVFEGILVVAVLVLGIWGWGLNSDNQTLSNQLAKANANPQAIVQKQAQDVITRVSKLMQLPANEQPTIANVTDAAAAKKQSAFFNTAVNGDKVLMYVKAGEAILYRPSTNKIVLVAPLTFNSAAATTPAAKTN